MHIPSIWGLLTGTRRELRNWAITAPLGCLVAPSRFLPPWNPLARSRLADRLLTLRLRNGMEIQCKASEFPPFLEAFVLRTYDIPGFDWTGARTVIDVGANVGIATLWLALQNPQMRIVAVEPSPDAIRRLRRNIHANALDDRVRVIEAAVGRESGHAVVATDVQSPTARVLETGPGALVRVMTLGEVFTEVGVDRIDVLKLDCEGAEYDVVDTAGDALARVGTIIGEYHPVPRRSPHELAARLSAAGFDVLLAEDHIGLGTFLARRTLHRRAVPAGTP